MLQLQELDKKQISRTFRTIIKPISNKKLDNDEFKTMTSKAIQNSTLGIRKFGIFLSGGIDSSLVAFELKNYLTELSSFTNIMEPNEIINGEGHNSDAKIAKIFSNEFLLNHKEIKITPNIILQNWDESIKAIEEPRYNWNLPMYYHTNKFLSQNNIVVTMAGDIGDEIYGGYQFTSFCQFFKRNFR